MGIGCTVGSPAGSDTTARLVVTARLNVKAALVEPTWITLAELREIALANGCTPGQFAQCVDLLGGSPDPIMLAIYLRFNQFLPADFIIPRN
jgi:hypothetical protein